MGPRDTLEKLDDPTQADEVDPKSYSFRLYIHMETGDSRYLHLNTGMWIGSGIRRGTEGMLESTQTLAVVKADRRLPQSSTMRTASSKPPT